MSTEAIAVFKSLCPNCGADITADRLAAGLPCERCLPQPAPYEKGELTHEAICKQLADIGCLRDYARVCQLAKLTHEFTQFFIKTVGADPWNLQLTWAKRVFAGRSFAILAPTGVGKTTFGLVMAAYLPVKSYIIVPTRLLVDQILARLREIAPQKVIAVYTGKRSERDFIASGEFDILVTTHMFLYRNCDLLEKVFSMSNTSCEVNFSKFFFVDDVDSFLKTSKNIDLLLKLMGFDIEDLNLAYKGDKAIEEHTRMQHKAQSIPAVLVVSSATAQPRTRRVVLFRELLGFDIQKATTTLRNVVDVAERVRDFTAARDKAVELIKMLGGGGFVYVSMDHGRQGVIELVNFFNSHGISAISYEDFDTDAQDKFRKSEIQVVVGISHHINPLVRGIDMPDVVRYAIFVGTPKLEIPVSTESKQPAQLLRLLIALKPALTERELVDDYIRFLRRYLTLREDMLTRYPNIMRKLDQIATFLRAKLQDTKFINTIRELSDVTLVERDGQLFIVVGDAASYIQASGRTSRLFAGGLTKGLSILLYYNEKAFTSLKRRIRAYTTEEVTFAQLEQVNLMEIMAQIDRDRSYVREIMQGRLPVKKGELMRTTLVIVESPTKARTIARFFGQPQRRWLNSTLIYEVHIGDRLLMITASLGHVFDIVEKGGSYGVLEVDHCYVPVYGSIKRCKKCGEQTTLDVCPRCHQRVDIDKLVTVTALRELATEVDEVFIATDPDAEGEKIAWDIFLALRPFNPNLKRAEFHEVTPRAFMEAINHPRELNIDLVKSQLVRRIADRWVGFALSEHLQRRFNNRNLSAGRVQTPVLGWVIAREAERRHRKAIIDARFDGLAVRFEIMDVEHAKRVFEQLADLNVKVIDESYDSLHPKPPFTTSELLIAASEVLGFTAEKTMQLAQELFEKGIITYHRTDSTRVSDAGLRVATEYIVERFGQNLLQPRRWGAAGAHECIRPVRAIEPHEFSTLVATGRFELSESKDLIRLYELIWRRFIASQMKDVVVRKVKVKFELPGFSEVKEFVTNIIEDGFNLVTPVHAVQIPVRFKLTHKAIRFVSKVRPFTQGTLIQQMRERGLGRPSTYAKIVSTLLERNYLVERRGMLIPTPIGEKVYRYLQQRFPKWTSEEFTRYLEHRMDMVESQQVEYQALLHELRSVIDEAHS